MRKIALWIGPALVTSVAFGWVNLAHGTPVTFEYSGIVQSTSGGSAYQAFVGEPFNLSYTFDSSAPASQSNSYRSTYFLISSVATVGTYVASGPSGHISIANDDPGFGDFYFVTSLAYLGISGAPIGGLPFYKFELILGGTCPHNCAEVLSSTSLPLSPPDPSDFGYGLLALTFLDLTTGESGVLTSGPISSIPEPSTALLLGLGLTGLAAKGRRRNRS